MEKLALIGNPNSGKTTLFNVLTGANQKVGNWPGVTVEKKFGHFELDDLAIELVDLPGIYSLEQEYQGIDEKIAQDYLQGSAIDLVINIIDATNLERGLVLTQQLMEKQLPLVIVLNMLDVAEQQGITLKPEALSERLGVPVVPIVASRKQGVSELESCLKRCLQNPTRVPEQLEETSDDVTEDPILKRYYRSQSLVSGVVEVAPTHHGMSERIDNVVLNRWLGIPFFLLMIYLMFTIAVNLGAVFIDFFDILFGAVLVDGSAWLLRQIASPEVLITLLAQGLGGGITLVATFIPVIGFLYLCLSILEDSGYMSRAAFVIDRLMGAIGLPGNAFVPLIVGFGCNVPAIMAARSLGRDSDRLLTIAMAPFMSCGARLTVYALFAASFFQQNGQNIVFALYLLGIGMAVFTGWIFRKQLFTGEMTPSFQEMPAYHIPVLRNILLTTWFRLKGFMLRAGKTIVGVVIVLSFLNSISTDFSFGNEDSENSMLSVIGKSITPAFAPLGIEPDNWPATVGLFTGMFAKEAIVGTLDALYSAPEDDADTGAPDLVAAAGAAIGSIGTELVALRDMLTDPLGISIGDVSDVEAVAEDQEVATSTLTNMAALFSGPFAAFCYLVFVLLYAPCVAVLGVINKEAGWHWTVLVFSWCTGLGYITASVIYQIGTFSLNPVFSSIWIFAMITILTVFIINLKKLASRMVPKNLIEVVQI
ncbi:MAG: ferrous iron transport protein B [Gammaproteobacteria bacterium]|jgi:ferrous iron transport protein B|nr:ferrous iron transport protein B [Gammaproteobacteria bacterium]MDP6095782.1 ferrous iron transport protein B [Gammaproteobacteria bacterium]|tara:strand:- start:221 stop:2338 length:2118 start_codon:yes stop_codon:yes gene_type:complete